VCTYQSVSKFELFHCYITDYVAVCSLLYRIIQKMSSSGESAVFGNLLSGTEVAKYVLISYIHVYKLINN